MVNDSITLLIADDTLIAREGLKSILEGVRGIHIIGEASSAQEAVQLAQERKPDVVLMDLLWHGDDTAGHAPDIQRRPEYQGARGDRLSTAHRQGA